MRATHRMRRRCRRENPKSRSDGSGRYRAALPNRAGPASAYRRAQAHARSANPGSAPHPRSVAIAARATHRSRSPCSSAARRGHRAHSRSPRSAAARPSVRNRNRRDSCCRAAVSGAAASASVRLAQASGSDGTSSGAAVDRRRPADFARHQRWYRCRQHRRAGRNAAVGRPVRAGRRCAPAPAWCLRPDLAGSAAPARVRKSGRPRRTRTMPRRASAHGARTATIRRRSRTPTAPARTAATTVAASPAACRAATRLRNAERTGRCARLREWLRTCCCRRERKDADGEQGAHRWRATCSHCGVGQFVQCAAGQFEHAIHASREPAIVGDQHQRGTGGAIEF